MPSSSNNLNKPKGDALEDYVAYLYEGFGYVVQRDMLLNGQQVDLLVTRQLLGAGTVRIAVECKYLSSGKVSNQNVYDFAAFVASAISRGAITKGVMVTNASYTRTAKAAANDSIELLTLPELENELFALRQIYREAVTEYEAEAVFREFITLAALLDSTGLRIQDVLSWLTDFVSSKRIISPSVVVLADYGAGKTTLLRRLFHDVAVAYASGRMELKPLYLELKYLNDQDDLDAFISSTLRRQMSIDMPMPLFWRELGRGGFLILLDGFDEMASQVDRSLRISNFLRISPLFRGGSPAVLTCRPSYFVNSEEYKATLTEIRKTNKQLGVQLEKSEYKHTDNTRTRVNLLYSALHEKYVEKHVSGEIYAALRYGSKGLQTILLEPFSPQQIQEYLSRFDEEFQARCKRSAKQVNDFLLTIYDLTDLMQKPILLSMIKDTILLKGEEFFDPSSDYGPATLYELYTSLNFDIDWAKGNTRRFLTREERRSFAQALAIAMYENSKLEVSYEDILEIVNKHQRILGALRARVASVTQEQVAADIQVCTFITRTSAEKFRFIHKSYMEFFVASFLNDKLSSQLLSARLLPKEIVYFLGSFARIKEPIAGRIKFLLERLDKVKDISRKKENLVFRSNIYRIYLYSVDQFTARSFRAATLDEIDLRNVRFGKVSFSRTSFYHNRWNNCGFSETDFIDCQIDDCTLAGVSLHKVDIKATISGTRKQKGVIVHSQLDIYCDRFEVEDTIIRNSSLKLHGTMYCQQSVIANTKFHIVSDDNHQSLIELSACVTDAVIFIAEPHKKSIPQLVLRECKLKKSILLGPLLSSDSLKNVKSVAQDCYGFALTTFSPTNEFSTSGNSGEVLKSDKEGFYWYSDTFVVIQLDIWKKSEAFIPDQVIKAILSSGVSQETVERYLSFWETWARQYRSKYR